MEECMLTLIIAYMFLIQSQPKISIFNFTFHSYKTKKTVYERFCLQKILQLEAVEVLEKNKPQRVTSFKEGDKFRYSDMAVHVVGYWKSYSQVPDWLKFES